MFRRKTAWFSNSVSHKGVNFWILEGGTVACWRTAEYLFSEDPACPDTVRIFESKDFLLDKVTVFHSRFLSVCEKRQSVKSVSIGHYVLPPASVLDEVRKVVGRMIWECEDEQSPAQDSQDNFNFSTESESSEEEKSRIQSELSDADSSDHSVPLCEDSPLSFLPGEGFRYVSMDNLQKYTGPLRDFQPE